MSTVIHTSAHLQPADHATVGDAPSSMYPGTQTVWVSLGMTLHIYLSTPEQAEAVALAFQDAAQRLRADAT